MRRNLRMCVPESPPLSPLVRPSSTHCSHSHLFLPDNVFITRDSYSSALFFEKFYSERKRKQVTRCERIGATHSFSQVWVQCSRESCIILSSSFSHASLSCLFLMFYYPSSLSPKKQPFPLGDSEEDSLKRFQHVTEMTILTVQLIVEFSKRVPGFETLLREDQITLLKVSNIHLFLL